MAKDIMVNEGASLKIINDVEKLVTKLPDDTTVDWIPEDEIQLVTKTIVQDGTYVASQEIGKPYGYSEVTVSGAGTQVIGQTSTKNITENGTYVANQDEKGPFYGYSKVIVNVSSYGSSSGSSGSGSQTSGTVGKDSTGDDVMAVVNPETGKIELKKIPSRIEVILPPTNPYITYNDGQAILKDGMVVRAYTENDEDWGEVPVNEVAITPNVAEYSKKESAIAISEVFDGEVYYSSKEWKVRKTRQDGTIYEYGGIISIDGVEVCLGQCMFNGGWTSAWTIACTDDANALSGDPNMHSYNYDNKIVYYVPGMTPGWDEGASYPKAVKYNGSSSLDNDTVKYIAWTAIYGTPLFEEGQRITVAWPRPGDNMVLTDTFAITVAPPYSSDGQ